MSNHHGRTSQYRHIGFRAASYGGLLRHEDIAPVTDQTGTVTTAGEGFETGFATWYGGRSLTGRHTASGEVLTGTDFTAAHMTLPFNTRLRVTNVQNGRAVVVRINDRGPFSHFFKLDLSEAAASALDLKRAGRAIVRMDLVEDSPQVAEVPRSAVQAVSGTYACVKGQPRPAASTTGGQVCP